MNYLLVLLIFINIHIALSIQNFSQKLPVVVLHGIASSKSEMTEFSSWITETYNVDEIGRAHV